MFVSKYYFSAYRTGILLVYPNFEAICVEDVLIVTAELDNAISGNIFIFLSQVKINQTNRALWTFGFEVHVKFYYVLLDLKPKFFAQRHESLDVTALQALAMVLTLSWI